MKLDFPSAFWSFFWRAVLFGFGMGFGIGFLGAMLKVDAGFVALATLAGGVFANYLGFKLGLQKYGIVQS